MSEAARLRDVEEAFEKLLDKMQDEKHHHCVAQLKLKDRLRAVEEMLVDARRDIKMVQVMHEKAVERWAKVKEELGDVKAERDAYKAFFDAWLGGRMDKAASYQSALNIMSSDDFRHR